MHYLPMAWHDQEAGFLFFLLVLAIALQISLFRLLLALLMLFALLPLLWLLVLSLLVAPKLAELLA